MVYIAVLGHGVVGSGVLEVLTTHTESIHRRAKEEICVKRILDLRDFPDAPYAEKFTKDFEDIINDDEIRIVVEVMGGLHPAYEYVKRCLLAGKSVVTSNKELVAMKGAELLQIAQEKNLNFLFEASVGGCIPIIRPISQCLAANEVTEIAGILNGTTNFILTKMIRDQMEFADALKLAQEYGYAERNPAADIEGLDVCRKICILASLTYGKHVYPDSVHTEGITGVTMADVDYAESWGGVIKLIGRVKRLEDDRIRIIVAPMVIDRSSQIASVDDVFNGILVRGDATGDVVFYGKGAGKLPTASAVVADIIDCVKHFAARKYLYWSDAEEGYVDDYKNDGTAVLVHASAPETSAALEKVRAAFGEIHLLARQNEAPNEFAFATDVMPEYEIDEKLAALREQGLVVHNCLRIADF